MASERQIAANRKNGAKGGPDTIEGKNRSRLNSVKHGLTATKIIVLPEEDKDEFEAVRKGFHDSLQPANEAEAALLDKAVGATFARVPWRTACSTRRAKPCAPRDANSFPMRPSISTCTASLE